jgi:hypothetical protein
MTAVDATAAHLEQWLATHAAPTDHDRRVIDADLLPGSSRRPVGDEDPYGKRADQAAADAWFAQIEPEQGRWAT